MLMVGEGEGAVADLEDGVVACGLDSVAYFSLFE